MVALKPQDVVVVLKLCTYAERRPSLAIVAIELGLSPSDVHAAIKRARASHLLHGVEMGERPNVDAILEFLVHGLKYAFPAKRGELSRGVATSYAAEPLKREVLRGSEPIPVWPYAEGKDRGVGFEPLYRTVPFAALRDARLYEFLAIADALRDGRARERKLAERELGRRLKSKR